MKKGFRYFLLLPLAIALYGGFKTGEWFFPLWIMVFCLICFLCTLKRFSSAVNSISDLVGGGNNDGNN